MKKLNLVAVFLLVLTLSVQVFASDYHLTNKRFVLSAISLCAMNETIQNKSDLDVYVLGDIDVGNELRIFFNQRVGNITLKSIRSGDELPDFVPDVLLLCNDSKLEEAKEFCRDNSVLSISNKGEMCQCGVSLAILAKMPKTIEHTHSLQSVYAKINKKALFAEGMKFYPQIMDVAIPVKDSEYEDEIVMVPLF